MCAIAAFFGVARVRARDASYLIPAARRHPLTAAGHRWVRPRPGHRDLVQRWRGGGGPRGEVDGGARSPSPRQTPSGTGLTVPTTGAKECADTATAAAKSARTRQRRCWCTRKTEVEEQSVGGGRHDVRAYIRVRRLIPRGPGHSAGPRLFSTPGTDSDFGPRTLHPARSCCCPTGCGW